MGGDDASRRRCLLTSCLALTALPAVAIDTREAPGFCIVVPVTVFLDAIAAPTCGGTLLLFPLSVARLRTVQKLKSLGGLAKH